MALPKVGFTPTSPDSFIIDAGVIVKDFKYDVATTSFSGTPIGATDGGVKVSIDMKYRDMSVDGAYLTPVVGLKALKSAAASIDAKLKELSAETMRMALNGTLRAATTDEAPTGYQVVEGKRLVEEGDYIKGVAVYGYERSTGKEIIFVLDNGLVTSKFEVDMKDQDEATVALTIEANATPDQLLVHQLPFRIFYPEVVA